MLINTDYYSLEIPKRWQDLVTVKKKSRYVDLVLAGEEASGHSGLLVRLKCLKGEMAKVDEYTEMLGKLSGVNGQNYWLYAAYGKEGAVSEDNEDLYWRLCDQLWLVFNSIVPAENFVYERETTD